MVSQFEKLGLLPHLVQTVVQMGFEEPTPIQLAALPALLKGQNVVGQAQTGTGKTAAFMLPILQQLQPQTGAVQALVMAPTRELAIQVAEASERMAQNTPTRVMAVYGGQSYNIQIRQLKRGVDIVVGTPGRLLDLIHKKLLDLSQVRFLVLDEADEMLKMGFIEDVETILSEVPEERQTALFSATMPKPIRKLAEKYLTNPYEIAINPKHMTVAEIEQRCYQVHKEGNKLEALVRLLEVEDIKSALIFARTRAGTRELADELMRRGYPADTLNGDLDQDKRELVLNRFREGVITLLIATDVAARGLDIEDMSHVINFDIPEHPEDYVHRIGRTGRAGRTGVAITLLTSREQGRIRRIESFTKQTIKVCQVPTREDILARRDQRFLERLTEQLGKGKISHERALIAQLSETSFDMVEIAAAAIQLARANEGNLAMVDVSQPVEKSSTAHSSSRKVSTRAASSPKKSKKSKDKSNRKQGQWDADMVKLKLNLGNAHGLRPGDVVGAIASEVGIPGRAIGEIDIHAKYTFVDVSEKHVRQILQQSSGQYSLRGKPVMLTRAN